MSAAKEEGPVLKLYTVEFDGAYPVGNGLVILAEDQGHAERIAAVTIKHTSEFKVREHPQEVGVVLYVSGDY